MNKLLFDIWTNQKMPSGGIDVCHVYATVETMSAATQDDTSSNKSANDSSFDSQFSGVHGFFYLLVLISVGKDSFPTNLYLPVSTNSILVAKTYYPPLGQFYLHLQLVGKDPIFLQCIFIYIITLIILIHLMNIYLILF